MATTNTQHSEQPLNMISLLPNETLYGAVGGISILVFGVMGWLIVRQITTSDKSVQDMKTSQKEGFDHIQERLEDQSKEMRRIESECVKREEVRETFTEMRQDIKEIKKLFINHILGEKK